MLPILIASLCFAEIPPRSPSSQAEYLAALQLKGDAARGKEAYKVCAACHLESAAGRADGTFPQLAGQLPGVLIKQIAEIRWGPRYNPVMHPFATTLANPQEIADVAAHIAALPIPEDNQRGPGVDMALGQKLYEKSCQSCHGKNGEGNGEKFYPVLAGQHYAYGLRQATDIRDGKRKNANGEMVKAISKLRDKEISTVVDYLARLRSPPTKTLAAP